MFDSFPLCLGLESYYNEVEEVYCSVNSKPHSEATMNVRQGSSTLKFMAAAGMLFINLW